jgi:hypothetical protein
MMADSSTAEATKLYLDYLDKEMTIQGIRIRPRTRCQAS